MNIMWWNIKNNLFFKFFSKIIFVYVIKFLSYFCIGIDISVKKNPLKKIKISQNLHNNAETIKLEAGQPIPKSVNYHFTRKCNYECGFCFHTAKTSFMLNLEDAKHGLGMLKIAGKYLQGIYFLDVLIFNICRNGKD